MELDDKLISALGSITVSFSNLELFISYFVWGLIGPDPKLGKITTSQMSFKHLLNLLNPLFKYRVHDDKKIEKLKALVKEADKARKKRNTCVHSFWWIEYGKIFRPKITAKRKNGFNKQIQEISIKELKETADFITNVAGEFNKFMGPILSSLYEHDEEDILQAAKGIQKTLSRRRGR